MARKDIDYIEVPERLKAALGEPDEGTRLYRQIGRDAEHDAWWKAVCEVCRGEGAVSPGGAAMFGPFGRAGVYKRLKEGRLTGFLFHRAPKGKRWKIAELFSRDGPGTFGYVPVVELRSWADLLRERRETGLEAKMDDSILRLKKSQLREYIKKRDQKK